MGTYQLPRTTSAPACRMRFYVAAVATLAFALVWIGQ